jgi:hypothetical protein
MSAPRGRLAAMRLLAELRPFYNDHRLCGELKGGVDGEVVWFVCECGARIVRQAYRPAYRRGTASRAEYAHYGYLALCSFLLAVTHAGPSAAQDHHAAQRARMVAGDRHCSQGCARCTVGRTSCVPTSSRRRPTARVGFATERSTQTAIFTSRSRPETPRSWDAVRAAGEGGADQPRWLGALKGWSSGGRPSRPAVGR